MDPLTITPAQPYDFGLSLRIARSFEPSETRSDSLFKTAVTIDERTALLTIGNDSHHSKVLTVSSSPRINATELRRTAEWMVNAELNLKPFYSMAMPHPVAGSIIRRLYGLKPFRPASLFEMLITAITEQQISLSAAYHIRKRLIENYGHPLGSFWAFPTPGQLSKISVAALKQCGLSQRKAEYINLLACRVNEGLLDLERLPTLSDDEVRTTLLQERGLGPWSIEYILVRGLGRTDRIPADDLGLRTIVGYHLGQGKRLTAQGVIRKLAPFKPYRGLMAFYLLAYTRISQHI